MLPYYLPINCFVTEDTVYKQYIFHSTLSLFFLISMLDIVDIDIDVDVDVVFIVSAQVPVVHFIV